MADSVSSAKTNFFTQHIDRRSQLFETFRHRFEALEKVYRDNISFLKKPNYRKNKNDIALKTKINPSLNEEEKTEPFPVPISFKGSRAKGSRKDFDFLNHKYKKDVANLTAELKRAEKQLRDSNVIHMPETKEQSYLYDIDHKDLLKILKDQNPVERFVSFNKKSNFVDDEEEAIAFLSDPLKVKKYLGFVKNKKNNRMTHYLNIREQKLVEKDLDNTNFDNSLIDTTGLVGKELRLAEKHNANHDFVETVANKKRFRRAVFRPVPVHGEASAKINLARWRQHTKEQAARSLALRTKRLKSHAKDRLREFADFNFHDEAEKYKKDRQQKVVKAIVDYVDEGVLPLSPPPLERQDAYVSTPIVKEVVIPDVIKKLSEMNKFQKRRAEESAKQKSKPAPTPDEIFKKNEKFNYIQSEKKASMVPFTNSKGHTFMVRADKYERMMETSRKRLLKKAEKLVSQQMEIKSESLDDSAPSSFSINPMLVEQLYGLGTIRWRDAIDTAPLLEEVARRERREGEELGEIDSEGSLEIMFSEPEEITEPSRLFNVLSERVVEEEKIDDSQDTEASLPGFAMDFAFNVLSGDTSIFSKILSMFTSPLELLRKHYGEQISGAVTNAIAIICLAFQVSRARAKIDVMVAITQYLTAYGISPALDGIICIVDTLANLAQTSRIVSEADEEIPLDARAPSRVADVIDSVRCFGTKLFTSDFASSIKMLALTVIAGKWFPKDIAKYLKHIVGVPTRMTLIEMAGSIMESVSMLVRIFEAWMKGVPVDKLLFAGDPVALFLSETEKLLFFKDKLYTGLPTPGAMCQKSFRSAVGKLIESGNAMYKGMNTFDPRKTQVKYVLISLNTAAFSVDEYMKTHNRTPPLAIVLHGPPSIGKSHLLRWFCEIWSRVKGRNFEESHIFNRSKTSEYWEGYNPISHPIIHCSEMGNMSTNMAKMQLDETLIELNSLIDGLPFNCDMAFDGKGKVYACPELVIIDTNNIEMHIHDQMFCPSAMFRRFLFIDVSVIGEFREENCTSLDKEASLSAGGNLLDRYYFDAFTYGANGKVPVRKNKFTHARIDEASVRLGDIFSKFLKANDAIAAALSYDFVKELIPLGLEPIEEKDIEVKEIEDADLLFVPSPLPSMLERIKGFVGRVGNNFKPNHVVFHNDDFELIPDLPAVVLSESLPEISRTEIVGALWSIPALVQSFTAWMFLTVLLAYRNTGSLRMLISIMGVTLFYGLSRIFPLWVLLLSYCVWQTIPKVHKDNLFVRLIKERIYEYTERRIVNIRNEYFKKFMWNVRTVVPFCKKPDHREYRNPYDWRHVAAVCAAITGAVVSLKKAFPTKRKVYQSQGNVSSFKQPSDANADLNAIEKLTVVQRDEVFVRTSKPETPQWNVVEKMSRQSTYNGTPESLFKVIGKNLRFVRVIGPTTLRQFLLGVRGTFALINEHIFMGEDHIKIEVYQQLEYREGAQFTTLMLSRKDCIKIADDIVAFDTVVLHFKDITKHFCDGVVKSCVGYINGAKVRPTYGNTPLLVSDKFQDFHITEYYGYTTEHAPGMCGQPLIGMVDRSGCAILGMHNSGAAEYSDAFSSVIEKSKLLQGLDLLYTPYLKVNSEAAYGVLDTTLPHNKSPFRHVYTGHVNYRGRDPDTMVFMNKHSRLELSPYHNEIKHVFYEGLKFEPTTHFSKPMMMPMTVNDEYISPFNIGLEKINGASPPFDSTIAQRVIDVMTDRIISGLHAEGLRHLSPLGVLEAINGVEGDPFTRRINASTSGAYGYPGKKAKYLPLNEGTEIREPTSELKHRLSQTLSAYLAEDTVMPIFTVQLKDEPREKSKCDRGKTRLFYMSPLDFLIVSRQFLSPFYTLMVEFPHVFGTAVGINMHVGSDAMAKKLNEFASKFLEGDYAGFDLRCPAFITRIVNTVVYNVVKHFGYTDTSLKIVQGIFTDTTFVNVMMNGDVFSKPGMQPSGKYATAEDNSLRGLAMLLCAWYSNPKLVGKDFFEYCLPYLYGDDVLVGLKDEIVDDFNNITYARFVEEHLGMEFTNSQKSGNLQKFLTFAYTSFLKRNMRWSDKWDRYIAPLDLNSIFKSLQWVMPSTFIPLDEQCKATITSALWELFFHCESEYVFNHFKRNFEHMLFAHFSMDPLEANLPGYWKIASALGFTGDPVVVNEFPPDGLFGERHQDGVNYVAGQEL